MDRKLSSLTIFKWHHATVFKMASKWLEGFEGLNALKDIVPSLTIFKWPHATGTDSKHITNHITYTPRINSYGCNLQLDIEESFKTLPS